MSPLDLASNARGRFARTALLALVPLLMIWWAGSGPVLDLMRPGADWLARQLHLANSISVLPSHDWTIDTGLERASGREIGPVILQVKADDLRRLLLGFPLFLALILAPPRYRPARSAFIGYAILAVLFWFSACSLILNSVSVILNHRPSLVMEDAMPPDFTVTQAPLGDLAFFLTGLSTYLAVQVLPLVFPIALWAALNRDVREKLIGQDQA